MVKLTEKTPLIFKTDLKAATASTSSSPDATNLESDMDRNGESEINEETLRQETVATGKAQLTVFSTRDKMNIGMLAAASFCSGVVYSCIAPFFPAEAKKKGASHVVTGFVFGIFELVIFLTSPIFGRYMTAIGSKFMYGTGLYVTGVTAILFGLLNWVPAGTTFIVFAFVIRIVEAIGDSASLTASYTIVANAYTARVATIIGILQTSYGIGLAVGPPIGGGLYEAGGFYLPFAVLGSFLIVAGLLSFLILPKQRNSPTKSKGSIFRLLRMQVVWTMVFAIVVDAVSLAFLNPTLQLHLSDLNLTPVVIGLIFLIMGGTCAASSPFWGYLIDRKDCARQVMLFGCASTFTSLIFIGPCPIFSFKLQLWLVCICQIFMGLGIAALFVPPFQQCLIAASNAGYPDTLETHGLIAGLFHSSFSFGAFLGPTLGGIGVEVMGFAWTASTIALLHVICASLIILLMVMDTRRRAKNSQALTSN